MHVQDQKEAALGCVLLSIRSTPGTEIVSATPDHVVFCVNRPRRTFEIDREGAHGFRVKETSLAQNAGRRAELECHERDVINQGQMQKWVACRLEEIRASSIFSGGLCLPDGSTILMMMVSALITFAASAV